MISEALYSPSISFLFQLLPRVGKVNGCVVVVVHKKSSDLKM